jgi:hypothetical protein
MRGSVAKRLQRMALRQAKAGGVLGPVKYKTDINTGVKRRMDWEGVLHKRLKREYLRLRSGSGENRSRRVRTRSRRRKTPNDK